MGISLSLHYARVPGLAIDGMLREAVSVAAGRGPLILLGIS